MRVIVNWGGQVEYNLDGIYDLAQMMKGLGYEVCLIEKDSDRIGWLKEHLGMNVVQREAILNVESPIPT
ncbi:MAG TPA: hypothetical protein VN426_00530 [Syntrophomonadaceae bacterium]|nr:hypothetical protein [Syntrophomonadaceae bacterium]